MQKRHADRQLYFNEQSITTQKYVIPFIEKHKPITADSHILEIGCGEGGNIKPFLDLGCQVTGIDINEGQIAIAKEIYSAHPNNKNLTLICEDIYKVTELHNKFDIIIIRDVIEHIPNQELFLPFIKRFLNAYGVIFVAFPPWQNPFGGHQQICNNKLLSHLPWFHLLPRPIYKKVLGKCQPWRTFGNQRYRYFVGAFSLDRAQGEVPYNRRSSLFHQPELRNKIQSASPKTMEIPEYSIYP